MEQPEFLSGFVEIMLNRNQGVNYTIPGLFGRGLMRHPIFNHKTQFLHSFMARVVVAYLKETNPISPA